jgi:hypothetical protein
MADSKVIHKVITYRSMAGGMLSKEHTEVQTALNEGYHVVDIISTPTQHDVVITIMLTSGNANYVGGSK